MMAAKRNLNEWEDGYVNPLTGKSPWGQGASLAWVDELGRVWRKPSDILERPELADPDPQGQKPSERD